jgi:hypothetical protein
VSGFASELPEDNPLDALVVAGDDTTSTEAETSTAPEGQGSPDATPESSAVQPEGQGQSDAETGLYDLSTVPEEHRSIVEQHLKEIERNANTKFQEAAEYRKSWEPFGELGLQEVGPQGVGALLQFAQDISSENPETARGAFMALAEAAGVDLAGAVAPQGEGIDPDDSADAPLTRAEFKAWQDKQQAEQVEAQRLADLRVQGEAGLRAEYTEVETLNGKAFDTTPGSGSDGELSEQAELIALAKQFQLTHDRPIEAAFQWMQRIRGQAEKALVDRQPTPPAPAERGGRASSPVEAVDDWDTAERLHRERRASVNA